jgi:hypothetical protein
VSDFKVGDKVVFQNVLSVPEFQFADGKVGVITEVEDHRLSYPFTVDFGDGNIMPFISRSELEAAE